MNDAEDIMSRPDVQKALRLIGAIAVTQDKMGRGKVRIGFGLGASLEGGIEHYVEVTSRVLTKEEADRMARAKDNLVKKERAYEIDTGKEVTDKWEDTDMKGTTGKKWDL